MYSVREHALLIWHAPPPAAATVAGEAPASRSWFCREKSMLYHSAALSTGLGGITRLGFSRTSSTYRNGNQQCESVKEENVLTIYYYLISIFLTALSLLGSRGRGWSLYSCIWVKAGYTLEGVARSLQYCSEGVLAPPPRTPPEFCPQCNLNFHVSAHSPIDQVTWGPP